MLKSKSYYLLNQYGIQYNKFSMSMQMKRTISKILKSHNPQDDLIEISFFEAQNSHHFENFKNLQPYEKPEASFDGWIKNQNISFNNTTPNFTKLIKISNKESKGESQKLILLDHSNNYSFQHFRHQNQSVKSTFLSRVRRAQSQDLTNREKYHIDSMFKICKNSSLMTGNQLIHPYLKKHKGHQMTSRADKKLHQRAMVQGVNFPLFQSTNKYGIDKNTGNVSRIRQMMALKNRSTPLDMFSR